MYAVASLIPVLILGFVVNRFVRHEIDQRALAEAVSRAQTISDSTIQPVVGGRNLSTGLAASQRLRLIQATTSLRTDETVLRLRVRSSTGDIVFDADHPLAKVRHTEDDEVQEAAEGEDVRVLTRLNADEVTETGRGDLGPSAVETYIALHEPGTTHVTGVLETYLPYAPFEDAAAASKRRLTETLAVALAVLWGVLGAVSWSVTRRLRVTAAENDWIAHHDPLTGLPNRMAFSQLIDAGLEQCDVAWVAVIDLARFHEVNDTVGHANGDRFLCTFAERLRDAVFPQGTVARLGGDEFGVLWPALGANSETRLLAAITEAVSTQVEVGGIRVNPEVTVGLANTNQIDGPAADLVRAADLANHAAKEAGAEVMGYVPELDQFDPDRLQLGGELANAISSGQLRLHYQPKLDLVTGEVRSVEALVRWQHPVRGLLPPAAFIPIAETTSLIRPLTTWVVQEAIDQIRRWRHMSQPITVSVNLSARSLTDSDLPDELLTAISKAGIAPRSLEVEITETSAIADPVRAQSLLKRLHGAGVRISLDDFGQGATSLVSLADLPIDELKVDRSFVIGMEESDAHRGVVEFVIALGHRLGLKVVAEGIETERAATLLTSMGCDQGQGYLFCHPLPPHEFELWLAEHRQGLADLAARSDTTAQP